MRKLGIKDLMNALICIFSVSSRSFHLMLLIQIVVAEMISHCRWIMFANDSCELWLCSLSAFRKV